jgi:hypothetical protein
LGAIDRDIVARMLPALYIRDTPFHRDDSVGKKDMAQPTQIEQRLQNLQDRLAQENPILLGAVKSFHTLDEVAYGLRFFSPAESYATRVSWWPLIAIVGTYSAGKSTFINHYLDYKLQLTGNQAVDDKFSVICYSSEPTARTLPGVALDADPRFPFYQMSRGIEEIAPGEGNRIDAYLQLKTCPSEQLRGKILIDSPGFDADAQRTSTLRITNHITDLSDLVLVFFDARHPEPGTMRDTLDHLVTRTVTRPDSSKFLYILNQIDTAAREDNPEDVVASWQRALAQTGLTAGRFYRIYSPEAAIPIEDEELRHRFEAKRDTDLADIHQRMQQVEVDRSYRIIAVLEQTARDLADNVVPRLQSLMAQWRQRVFRTDGIVFGVLIVGIVVLTWFTGTWQGWSFTHPFWDWIFATPGLGWAVLAVALILAAYIHHSICKTTANRMATDMQRSANPVHHRDSLDNFIRAFRANATTWRSLFARRPRGWSNAASQRLKNVLIECDRYIQELNDKFTNPAGSGEVTVTPPVKAEVRH